MKRNALEEGPMSGGSPDTFPRLLLHQAAVRADQPAMREKDLGIWQTWSWGQVCDEVHALACGLAELGFKRGDNLAIIGDNRPRLYLSLIHISEPTRLGMISYAVF